VKAHPEIPGEIAAGRFDTLHAWLTENLYRHGRKFTPDELVARATGDAMSIAPYLAYLRGKYGEFYRLPEQGAQSEGHALGSHTDRRGSL